jgi:hypothetical protein
MSKPICIGYQNSLFLFTKFMLAASFAFSVVIHMQFSVYFSNSLITLITASKYIKDVIIYSEIPIIKLVQ